MIINIKQYKSVKPASEKARKVFDVNVQTGRFVENGQSTIYVQKMSWE